MTKPIPQPRAFPLVGNLFDLDVATPIQTMMELAQEYGPIFRLQVPTEDLVVISSAALAHEVCDEARFDKKVHGPLEVVRDYAGDGLITAYTSEPNWEKAHRILLPAFGGGSLRRLFPAMRGLAEELVLKWERFGPEHAIDVSDDMTRLTVDTIALCGFGYRLNSFYSPELHPFVGAMVRSLTESSARTRRVPGLSPLLLGKRRQYAADIRLMHDLADRIIARRRAEPDAAADDVLTTMLNARDSVTGEALDDANIRHQMVTFLIAGHETTSGLLSFALLELLRHPEALAKAYAVVDETLGGRPVEYADLSRLGYLDQVLKETLRLWPTAPAFAVYSKEPATLLAGTYPVRREQTILLLLPSLHRDPAVWEESAAFRPERMAPERFRALPPGAWKPFGNGQRACIGRAFALQEAMIALASVLQRFRLEPAQPLADLRIKESLTIKPVDFRVYAHPRTPRPSARATPAVSAAASRSGAGRLLTLLYGTKGGTARGYAEELGREARARGYRTEVLPLDARADGPSPADGTVLFLTASYDGRPPENARAFFHALAHAAPGRYAGISFAVFGCGNRDWARTFQAVPKLLARRLRELGGRELLPRGEGDARGDQDQDFREWKERLWPALGEAGERPTAAERLADYLGLGPGATLAVEGTQRDAVTYFGTLALGEPATSAQVRALAEAAACPPERAALLARAERGGADSVLDLAEAHGSVRLAPADFLEILFKR